ncbi:DUF6879 family protein [Streptomyces sp. NPDC050428]|uniref:DUF6879 family protein n=1 Tax=Streptomyces sp. NPDC050428 TaxID=3155757 RepID=UPI00342F4F13
MRVLTRAEADHLRLPEEDFWIFDMRVVALLHFDTDDEMTGVELITNPIDVLRYAQTARGGMAPRGTALPRQVTCAREHRLDE